MEGGGTASKNEVSSQSNGSILKLDYSDGYKTLQIY